MTAYMHSSGRLVPIPQPIVDGSADQADSNEAAYSQSPFRQPQTELRLGGTAASSSLTASVSETANAGHVAAQLTGSLSAQSIDTPAGPSARQPLFEGHSGVLPSGDGDAASPGGTPSQPVQLATVPPHRLSTQVQLCLRHAYGPGASAEDVVRDAPGPYRSLADVGKGMSAPAFQAWREEVEKAWYAKVRTMPRWQGRRGALSAAASTAATSFSRAASFSSNSAVSGSSGKAGSKGTQQLAVGRSRSQPGMGLVPAGPQMGPIGPMGPMGQPMAGPMGWPAMAPGGGFAAQQAPQQLQVMMMVPLVPMMPMGPMGPMAPGPMPYGMPADPYAASGYGMGYGW